MSDAQDPTMRGPARADGRWLVTVGAVIALLPWVTAAISAAALAYGVAAELAVNPPMPVAPPHHVPNPVPLRIQAATTGGLAGVACSPALGAALGVVWAAALARRHPERRWSPLVIGTVACGPLAVQLAGVLFGALR